MLDLTSKTRKSPTTSKIRKVDSKESESTISDGSREELKGLSDKLEDDLKSDIKEVRERTNTVKSDHLDKVSGSVFDFLLEEKYHLDFLELLRLNQTLADPDNTRSKKTMLSQKKFLELVKGFIPGDERLQSSTQSSFYKWLARNGLGTREQIIKYYKSRSKEVANQEKRTIIMADMVTELGKSPELIKKLFSYPEVQQQIRDIIKNDS